MNNKDGDEIIYSLCTDDIQNVAKQVIERPLTKDEIALVQDEVGDHIDWFQAIEKAIGEKVAMAT